MVSDGRIRNFFSKIDEVTRSFKQFTNEVDNLIRPIINTSNSSHSTINLSNRNVLLSYLSRARRLIQQLTSLTREIDVIDRTYKRILKDIFAEIKEIRKNKTNNNEFRGTLGNENIVSFYNKVLKRGIFGTYTLDNEGIQIPIIPKMKVIVSNLMIVLSTLRNSAAEDRTAEIQRRLAQRRARPGQRRAERVAQIAQRRAEQQEQNKQALKELSQRIVQETNLLSERFTNNENRRARPSTSSPRGNEGGSVTASAGPSTGSLGGNEGGSGSGSALLRTRSLNRIETGSGNGSVTGPLPTRLPSA